MSRPLRSLAKEICPPFVWNAGRKLLGRTAAPQPLARKPQISEEEAELQRLWSLPRRVPTIAHLLGREFKATCPKSFASVYDACFRKEHYRFAPSIEKPLILDCGANVGITVQYWKRIAPGARVIAFEPDEENFEALTFNCKELRDVTCRKEAVWTAAGPIRFAAVGGDAGHLSELAKRTDAPEEKVVQAVRLRDFLLEPVELLKMDIEGAEVDVIADCADRLNNVRFLFVEFHSFINRPQRLWTLLQVIEQAGFRIHGHTEMAAPQPFLSRPAFSDIDFRLNLYCVRGG